MEQKLRDELIVKARRDGETLQKIGDAFGLTRERIRQIVEKNKNQRSKIKQQRE